MSRFDYSRYRRASFALRMLGVRSGWIYLIAGLVMYFKRK